MKRHKENWANIRIISKVKVKKKRVYMIIVIRILPIKKLMQRRKPKFITALRPYNPHTLTKLLELELFHCKNQKLLRPVVSG
jgi:hypothetical protein